MSSLNEISTDQQENCDEGERCYYVRPYSALFYIYTAGFRTDIYRRRERFFLHLGYLLHACISPLSASHSAANSFTYYIPGRSIYIVSLSFNPYQRHTQRDRRPSTAACSALLGDGDKGIETVYGEEKIFVLGRLEQPRQNKNLFYRHNRPHEPTKKGPLSFVLFESPFTSVSTEQSAGATTL
jgi:hypothetical protein